MPRPGKQLGLPGQHGFHSPDDWGRGIVKQRNLHPTSFWLFPLGATPDGVFPP